MKKSFSVNIFVFLLTCILSSAVVAAKPLKIYVLVGQSNMQGHAKLHTMPYMAGDPSTKSLYDKILDANGKPRVHNNVHIVAYSEAGKGNKQEKKGPLTMGYGSNLGSDTVCGPELAFGITMREKVEGPILIIKTAWGGKSLNTDFRPPSAGKYALHPKIKALWNKHPNGAHGIPKMSSRPKWHEEKEKNTGYYYRLMIRHLRKALANLKNVHPDYDPKLGYELAGFVWFQGWNDMCDGTTYPDSSDNADAYVQYSNLLAHFIRDIRKEFNVPKMPVVIGVIGVDGDKAKGSISNLRLAMTAPVTMPEFKGNVEAVQTKNFWDYKMAALEGKKRKVDHRLRSAHLIGEDGFMEPRDTGVAGWKVVGSPPQKERVWRFTSVEPSIEKDKLSQKEKKRFRDITLPTELKDWYKPNFNDSKWERGRAPIGKGNWKFRGGSLVKYRAEWGKGEFLLMRTTFNIDKLDYIAYRLAALSRQGYHVYLNGYKLQTYIWWKDKPHYMVWNIADNKAKYLKRGKNVLAVYANSEYHGKARAPFGVVDMVIEGITKNDLEYVKSHENKLRIMDKECSREEGKIIMGCSNGGYHYLGSGKMLSQIGEAFANAMVKLQKN